MIRRPVAWLALSLLGAILLAGCGSSSTTTNQSTSTPAATTNATTAGATSPSGASTIATQAAIEACKRQIQTASTLSASSKSRLEGLCVKAASGNTPEVKKAVREVCEETVNKSPLPAVGKEQALATCRSRTK